MSGADNARANYPVRAAIVGLGAWGRTLVSSAHQGNPLVRFVAACTRSPAKAQEFCARHGIAMANDLEALLADRAIDAVVFATPNSQHRMQVEQASRAGKHVFVEKPFALRATDAVAAIEAATRSGVTLAVGFNRRFHPLMQELRTRARDGRLGVLVGILADLTATTGFYRSGDSWRVDPTEEPAGALAGIGVHLIDAMIEIVGRIREVYCISERRAGPHGDDTTHLTIRFESGMTGSIFCSLAATRYSRFAVYGSQAYAELLRPAMDTLRIVPAVQGRASHLAALPPPEVIEVAGFNTVRAQFDAFARSIREHVPYPVPLAEVLHGVEVFEAAVESARSGVPVRVAA